MASSIYRRYMWLVRTIGQRRDGLTFGEINERWLRCSLNYDRTELSKRTFRNWLIYALDRIAEIEETDETFCLKRGYSANQDFEGCIGITAFENVAIEEVRLKITGYLRDYIETLPIHTSPPPSCKKSSPTSNGTADTPASSSPPNKPKNSTTSGQDSSAPTPPPSKKPSPSVAAIST